MECDKIWFLTRGVVVMLLFCNFKTQHDSLMVVVILPLCNFKTQPLIVKLIWNFDLHPTSACYKALITTKQCRSHGNKPYPRYPYPCAYSTSFTTPNCTSKIRHEDFLLGSSSVALRVPPLKSEMGWTGELILEN